MAFTLRQFQKVLSSATRKRQRTYLPPGEIEDVRAFVQHVWGKNLEYPLVSNRGRLVDDNDSGNYIPEPIRRIDSLAKRYGPNTPITQFIPKQDEKSGGGAGPSGEDGDPDESSEYGEGSGDASNESPRHEEKWEPTPAPPPPAPKPPTKEERHAETLRQMRDNLRKMQEQAAALKQPPAQPENVTTETPSSLAQALMEKALQEHQKKMQELQGRIKAAVKQQSKMADALGQISSPSLESRRRAAGTHGRLRRVPIELRNKAADIINRLVSETGVAGDRLSPIPVLSPRKVVKRMVVRRPLSNALKEDSNSGRPVTLFLPDVSPSCESQAQIACDISNAAGYAGVSGSDVLVFPHSNGCVEEGYVPWFNGRPHLVNEKTVRILFKALTSGDTKYDIRVVVAIGDHDAVTLYGEIAARKSVRRLVWLHNSPTSERRPRIVSAEANQDRLGWSPDVRAKTTLVYGCVGRESILAGLELSLK